MINYNSNTSLSAEEIAVCKNLNISEEDYIRANALNDNHQTKQSVLSASELAVCKSLNISEEDYIKANVKEVNSLQQMEKGQRNSAVYWPRR